MSGLNWKSSFVSENLKSLYLEAPPPSYLLLCPSFLFFLRSIMKLSYFSLMSLACTPQEIFVSTANWKI